MCLRKSLWKPIQFKGNWGNCVFRFRVNVVVRRSTASFETSVSVTHNTMVPEVWFLLSFCFSNNSPFASLETTLTRMAAHYQVMIAHHKGLTSLPTILCAFIATVIASSSCQIGSQSNDWISFELEGWEKRRKESWKVLLKCCRFSYYILLRLHIFDFKFSVFGRKTVEKYWIHKFEWLKLSF